MAIFASDLSFSSFSPRLDGRGGGSCFSFGLAGGRGGSAGREVVVVDDDDDCIDVGLGGIDDDDDKFPFFRSLLQVTHPQQHIINTPTPISDAIQISTVCHHHKGATSFILITYWSPKSAFTL